MKNKDVFMLEWCGFEIEVSFIRSYSAVFEKAYEFPMSHIEIRAISPLRAALPITETGYRSIFMALPEIEDCGGVKTLILNELNKAAENRDWKKKEMEARQYKLF